MSFNFELGFVPNADLSQFTSEEATISFEEASGYEASADLYVAQAGDNVIFVSIGGLAIHPAFAEPVDGTATVILAGTSDTYVFEHFGPHRMRVQAFGEIAQDQGEPLPVEHFFEEYPDDAEDAHLQLFQELARIEDIWSVTFAPIELSIE